jgi:6-phosphogluconolactonase
VRWHVFPDAGALAAAAVERIAAAAREAIAARGAFRIVLAGGRTPLAVYARLATMKQDWTGWQVYFGDERCLPVGDAGRNDTAARAALLARVAIPNDNIHCMPAELGPQVGAARYAALLQSIDSFDLVLLGLGEDGHTASLFPGQALGGADVLAVRAAPKPPPMRVSLSAARLSRARQVLFLVTGSDKRAAVSAWRSGQDIPARHVTPAGGVDVLLDARAAGGTDDNAATGRTTGTQT